MSSSLDDRLPPGTVLLISRTAATEMVLQPTPSNDPNEPLNWSIWRKLVNFTFVLAVTVASFTAIQVQAIFWPQMLGDMDVNQRQLSYGLAVQVVGLAMGCLLLIPLTKKYGKRLTYILATLVMAGMSFWSAEMKTAVELYMTNLLYGLACSVNETVVQMTIADLFFVHQRGSANAAYIVAVMVGSFLTTMAAGVQAEQQGWRWSYRSVGIALTILAVLFILFFEESKYIPVTEGYSARSLGVIPSHDSSLERAQEKNADVEKTNIGNGMHPTMSAPYDSTDPPPRHTYRRRMRLVTKTNESLLKLAFSPLRTATLPHVLYTAIQYANAISFLVLLATCNSILFSAPPYNFNVAGIGYMALGPFVGNVFGSIYGGPFTDWFIVKIARRRGGYYEPEMRLYSLGLPALCMSGGIIMYGTTIDRGMHWIFPSIGGALFAFGLGSIGDASFTLIIDTYRELTAECFVFVTFVRNAVTVAVPFYNIPWIESMGLTKMFVMAGCINLFFSLLFIPLVIYGKRIRIALHGHYDRMVESQ